MRAPSSTPPPLSPGDIITFTPRMIDDRDEIEIAEGGGSKIRLIIGRADQVRLNGAKRIDIVQDEDATPVELYQQLALTVTDFEIEDWGRYGMVRVLNAVATPVPFEPKFYPKVDGIDGTDCRALERRFGADFAKVIALDFIKGAAKDDLAEIVKAAVEAEACPLSVTRFSKPKQVSIIGACVAEICAAKDDTAESKKIISLLCACHVSKGKARQLAASFDKTESPYQHFFTGRLSFLEGDRFAHLFDPVRAENDRRLAIVTEHFLGTESVVISERDIVVSTYKNFGVFRAETEPALKELIQLGHISREGDLFGLTRLIEAERNIAEILLSNETIELTEEITAVVQMVTGNAASFLDKPGFVLSDEQAAAIWMVFKNRFSVITGPPGTGKTAIVALINVIATMIYQIELPGFGVALAAIAANNLCEAATCWWKGKAIPMEASTIHKALGMEPTDDDDYVATKEIRCGVFFAEEMSMNSSPLVNTMLRCVRAFHTVFIGDEKQLPPIGSGKPLPDIVASKTIPVTWLTRNYRTECAGIRALCDDILNKNFSPENAANYEAKGGVEFVPCDRSKKADTAAEIYADLVVNHNKYQVAILSPHNAGDGGTRSINVAVRKALKLPEDRIVEGDLLLVVANNYKANRADGRGTEVIRNGERCSVVKVGRDFFNVEFPKNSEGIKRRVQFLTSPKRLLPVGIEFGYALSVHKFQGSQASVVIALAEPGTKAGGIVQGSNIYTCCSRARDHLIVLGNLDDFNKATHTPEIRRDTLLLQLLKRRDHRYSEKPTLREFGASNSLRPVKTPPPVIEVGARVSAETLGDGVILAVEDGKFGKAAQVKFDDGA